MRIAYNLLALIHTIAIITGFSIQGNAPIVIQWPIINKGGEIERVTVHFWWKDEHFGPWAGHF